MKALCKQTMGFILMILLACGVTSIKAQDSADDEFISILVLASIRFWKLSFSS